MAQINILVVEDEIIVSKDIQNSLKKLGYNIVGSAASGEKAIEVATSQKPDLILMDIMLKGDMNGIEAAEKIKEKLSVPIIFLTAYAEDATLSKAKMVEPYGYILKPFKEIDLKTAIEVAVYKHSKEAEIIRERDLLFQIVESKEENDFVFIKSKSRFVKINIKDILLIEALKDYVIIHTNEGKFTVHSTMKEIEKKFDFDNFFRVHRSYIININKIKSIEHSNILLEGYNKEIPIGGSYKENFSNKMKWV
jgi:DNA-binding LytR/AlgR family response regulator